MLKKRLSTEKMDIQKQEWTKEQKILEIEKEEADSDEIGTTIFTKGKSRE